jgi:putative PIN family toxin of toxin-antitoxin system
MLPSPPMSAVFDCMVYLQAVGRESGPSFACLELCEQGAVRLYISQEILEEVRDVLSRPSVQRKFPRLLVPERVEAFLLRVEQLATLIETVPARFSYERDPKDEKYINLAL